MHFHTGPGGIHLLNGIYDAKMDYAPVLAITGLQHSELIGKFTQQEVALDKLLMDVTLYNERIVSGAHMESVTDLAIRTALASRGVAHITIPVGVQVQEVKKGSSDRNPMHHTSATAAYFESPAGIGLLGTQPSQDALEDCDMRLMVGTSFPYIEFLPEPGSIKCVQIEIDPQRISLRHPADS